MQSFLVTLQIPGNGGLDDYRVEKNKLAYSDNHFLSAFGKMLLSTRASGSWNNEYEPELLQKVLKDNQVTCKELHDAFYKAYSDHFTPQSGIEWRHLWKHIEKSRLGSGDKIYTRKEMLDIVHRENIDTDHFEFLAKDQWKRK